jgi:acid stress chaperone HdeB
MQGEDSMTTPKVVAAGLMLLFATVSAQAQVSIDISKITCDQFTLFRITDPRNIAIWLHGYFSGKRGNTLIDTQVFNENFTKLKDYCSANPRLMVMQAVETLFNVTR